MSVVVKLEGIGNVHLAFQQLVNEIGDKNATSKVLVPAVREAMKPVLARARAEAPVDTGALKRTLQVEARRPTKRDIRSKYIMQTDTVIALVTTKAFPKKLKKQWMEENKNLQGKEKAEAFRKFALSTGFPYDGRAIAQEFGTASMKEHKPFLRPALEGMAQETVNTLGKILGRRINEFKRT
jgi:HK97 gp10 family phage protein